MRVAVTCARGYVPCLDDAGAYLPRRVARAMLDRYRGGESVASLARDYELPRWLVEIVCHGRRKRKESPDA